MRNRTLILRVPTGISLLLLAVFSTGCSKDWPAFRHNTLRTAAQIEDTALSDPAQVPNLAVRWTFTAPGAPNNRFRASPIVYEGRVYVGNQNGHLYALDANTGALIWQYPAAGSPGFSSQFTCNPSSQGIASSAAIASVNGTDAVIFGAPDQSIGTHYGEGRLFALNAATGSEIWKSPVIAKLNDLTGGNAGDAIDAAGAVLPGVKALHEQIGYSSPLVFNDRVYIGVADHCDNPIQQGRVVAVFLNSGSIDGAFTYCSTGVCGDNTRGGGVWSSVMGWNGLYITTGNTNNGGAEPAPNNGLSLLRLNQTNGSVIWKFQPVPYDRDWDPDWAASPTYMGASCGGIVISTMKDGWTHALNAGDGVPGPASRRWSFPPATIPFTAADGTVHGDSRYMRSGAAWDDVYVTMNGGLNLNTNISAGYRRLYAFNVCAGPGDLLRWFIDVPGTSGFTYSLGSPTINNGIVYIGTDQGHLVAIADPSVHPGVGWRCSNPDVTSANCVAMGYAFVPQPAVLADVQLDGRMVYTEPALARGKVYVSTEGGKVYMLSP
jgi:outer membrane protein assembly factor BamB